MKKLALTVLSGVMVSLGAHAQSDVFSTIQNWTGTGANEAGLVIDWYNGTTSEGSMLWGYRWDGSANVEQMFDAIVASDPRLFSDVSPSGMYGTAVYGIGYAATGDEPISLTPSLTFPSDHLDVVTDGDDSRTANNPGDLWLEGWQDSYWALYTSTDTRLTVNESDWTSADFGITGQVLNNDDIDGLVFAPGFDAEAPTSFIPAPVPEPTTWALLLAGGLLCWRFGKSKFSATT